MAENPSLSDERHFFIHIFGRQFNCRTPKHIFKVIYWYAHTKLDSKKCFERIVLTLKLDPVCPGIDFFSGQM